jgi:hypothetical protein
VAQTVIPATGRDWEDQSLSLAQAKMLARLQIPGVAVHTCGPSCTGGRRILIWGPLQAKTRVAWTRHVVQVCNPYYSGGRTHEDCRLSRGRWVWLDGYKTSSLAKVESSGACLSFHLHGKHKQGNCWSPDKNRDPMPKTVKAKRPGGIAQVIEHLPSKSEALSWNPSST